MDLMQKLEGTRDRNTNIMLVPVLRNAAAQYHAKAKTHRDKAENLEEQKRAARYNDKCGGNGRYVKTWETTLPHRLSQSKE